MDSIHTEKFRLLKIVVGEVLDIERLTIARLVLTRASEEQVQKILALLSEEVATGGAIIFAAFWYDLIL